MNRGTGRAPGVPELLCAAFQHLALRVVAQLRQAVEQELSADGVGDAIAYGAIPVQFQVDGGTGIARPHGVKREGVGAQDLQPVWDIGPEDIPLDEARPEDVRSVAAPETPAEVAKLYMFGAVSRFGAGKLGSSGRYPLGLRSFSRAWRSWRVRCDPDAAHRIELSREVGSKKLLATAPQLLFVGLPRIRALRIRSTMDRYCWAPR